MEYKRLSLYKIRKILDAKFSQYRYRMCANELEEIKSWIIHTGNELIKNGSILDFDITELGSGYRSISPGKFEDVVTFRVGVKFKVENHLPPYGMRFIIEETETNKLQAQKYEAFDRAMKGI